MTKEQKISYSEAIKTSFSWGLKNFPSILGAVILWALTCWIPYLNIGTTIALATLPIEISKGKMISPTFIFDHKYRQFMGEFFLLNGLKIQATSIGYLLFIIPGIVISIAWSLSNFLLLDKGINPMEALSNSNKYTDGNKGAMFLSYFIILLIIGIAALILSLIPFVGFLLTIIVMLIASPVLISLQAYFYKVLVLDKEQIA